MRPSAAEEDGLEPEQFRKVFVGGISFETTDSSLREYFEKYGKVVDCVVMRDPVTNRTRGFGFVAFQSSEQVDAVQNARPHTIDNKEVETKRAMPREESNKIESHVTVKKIFIGGLKDDADEEALKSHFSQFGSVENVSIVLDSQTGRPRGFAFATFNDYDSVDRAVLLKNHEVGGRRIEVKKALSKEELNAARIRERGGPMRSRDPGYGGRRSGYDDGYRSGYGGDYGGSSRGYGGGNRGYRGSSRGYGGASKGYDSAPRDYERSSRGYEGSGGYGESSRSYGGASRGYDAYDDRQGGGFDDRRGYSEGYKSRGYGAEGYGGRGYGDSYADDYGDAGESGNYGGRSQGDGYSSRKSYSDNWASGSAGNYGSNYDGEYASSYGGGPIRSSTGVSRGGPYRGSKSRERGGSRGGAWGY